jgi:hypothetical protein
MTAEAGTGGTPMSRTANPAGSPRLSKAPLPADRQLAVLYYMLLIAGLGNVGVALANLLVSHVQVLNLIGAAACALGATIAFTVAVKIRRARRSRDDQPHPAHRVTPAA